MNRPRSREEQRVLLLAPTARDAQTSQKILSAAQIECVLCGDLDRLRAEMAVGAGAIILPEEAMLDDIGGRLEGALRGQPVWSDLPVIVLSRSGAQSPAVDRALSTLGNVSLIERPVRVSTLVSHIRSALRARQRQYQVRDLLAGEQAARVEADAANSAKDRFLAVLSHELRTPLSPVVMSLAAMEEHPGLPASLRDDVALIRRNIDLEVKLIDDLLDMSRVTNGKLHLQRRSTAVHDLLRHVFQICAKDLEAKQIAFISELSARQDQVMADPARLQQVFWNLLKNAIRFTPQNGSITVRTLNLFDGRLVIEVKDTGIGIAAALLPKIFDAFEQENALAAGQGGLGLGLAISKTLVDLHGGTIQASSAGRNQGACFTVTLALTQQAAEDPGSAAAAAVPAQGRRHLLIVEDHLDTAEVLARLLQSSGYIVATAGSVAEALEAAAAVPFDLLISDIGLPDASGLDLMRQVRERYGIPGIALSGYGMEEDIRKSQEAGFLDHITKPVNLDHLRAVIQRVVD
jgi:signal transduction histidine kinase/CheY-like chemotaxis protein